MDITINDYEYHRNGVAGVPFYTLAFDLTEDGTTTSLWASIPADYIDETAPKRTGWVEDDTQWQVINPRALHSNWRGDVIGSKLRPIFEARLKADR